LKKVTHKNRSIISFLAVLILSQFVYSAPGTTNFQAHILSPDGQPLQAPSVNFTFYYKDTLNTCTLYVEEFTNVSMVSSNGDVSLKLGTGTRTYPTLGGMTYFNMFSNSSGNTMTCLEGGNYTPLALTENRKLTVTFTTPLGVQSIGGLDIESVPFAMYASEANSADTSTDFTGTLSGDVTGNQVSTSVVRLRGTPVVATAPTLNQILQFDGTNWSPASIPTGSGTVTNVTGTAPISVATGTSTPVISMSTAATAQDGYLTSTDWNTFNNKLGAASPLSGDVSGTSSTTSVDRIKATPVTITAITSGNFLRYNGAAWVNAMLGLSDIPNMDAAHMPAFTGDVTTTAGSTATTLSTTGVGAGTYQSVTVDTKGRVTGGSALTAGNITTALTYTPVNKAGDTMSGVLAFIAGSVGAPSITFSGDTNNGLYSPAADILAVTTDGVERLRIDSTGLVATRAIASTTNVIASGGTVDLSLSNIHALNSVGGSVITISNMSNGAAYTLVVRDTTVRTYTFSGCATTKFSPTNGQTEVSSETIYGLTTVNISGSWYCYVTWASGFN
jgi:hypothetical protein